MHPTSSLKICDTRKVLDERRTALPPVARYVLYSYVAQHHIHVEFVQSLCPCPYTTGTQLTLEFQEDSDSPKRLVEVVVVHAHSPFTVAQSMLVRRTQPHPTLPSQFVLKVVDPRFSEPQDTGLNREPGWTAECDAAFNRGLSKVRSGEWSNYWPYLGAVTAGKQFLDEYGSSVDKERHNWMDEMAGWHRYRSTLEAESAAYHTLRFLQGSDIPRLYGTCTVLLYRTTPGLDPIVGNVPGLVLEYVDGTPLNRLTVGKDLSVSEAERVSQGALAVLRKIRDALVIHGDFASRNIIVRPHDLDHPALIDFGSADTYVPGAYSKEDWIGVMVNDSEVLRARRLLGEEGFHYPSPIPEYYDMIATVVFSRDGYAQMNRDIEAMPPDLRSQYFEPAHDVPPDKVTIEEDGSKVVWEYPRWQVKPGGRTANGSADFKWGR